MAYNFVIGPIGSDAGYWVIGADGKIHHVGGWQIDSLADFSRAVDILRSAAQIKSPELASELVKIALPFVQRELATHVKGEGTVLLGGP
jgi:hypothetical protein